jgi:hypothetical protein
MLEIVRYIRWAFSMTQQLWPCQASTIYESFVGNTVLAFKQSPPPPPSTYTRARAHRE